MSWRFDIKTDRNVDKANSKIFRFNFASFPAIVTDTLLSTRILYAYFTDKEIVFIFLFRTYLVF